MPSFSKSGVRISDDFRDNLIIDRYDPAFATMNGHKLQRIRSENSEDAVTWNVFRSLRQIDPAVWLPEMARRGLPDTEPPPADGAVVRLWRSIAPPRALVDGGDDEGESEIDIAIEGQNWVWFIEAKYTGDISKKRRDARNGTRCSGISTSVPGTPGCGRFISASWLSAGRNRRSELQRSNSTATSRRPGLFSRTTGPTSSRTCGP